MARALRGLGFATLLLLPALLAVPLVAAESTSIVCYGGQSDPNARPIDSGRILSAANAESPLPAYYVTTSNWLLWEETNGRSWLQQTDRICTENTIDDDGVLISSTSWIEVPADTRVDAGL